MRRTSFSFLSSQQENIMNSDCSHVNSIQFNASIKMKPSDEFVFFHFDLIPLPSNKTSIDCLMAIISKYTPFRIIGVIQAFFFFCKRHENPQTTNNKKKMIKTPFWFSRQLKPFTSFCSLITEIAAHIHQNPIHKINPYQIE